MADAGGGNIGFLPRLNRRETPTRSLTFQHGKVPHSLQGVTNESTQEGRSLGLLLRGDLSRLLHLWRLTTRLQGWRLTETSAAILFWARSARK